MTPTRSTSRENPEPTGRLTDVPTVKLVAIHIHLELRIYIAKARRSGWVAPPYDRQCEQVGVGLVNTHRRPKIQLWESVEESSNRSSANTFASSVGRGGPFHQKWFCYDREPAKAQ